jgi:hypothetical protein
VAKVRKHTKTEGNARAKNVPKKSKEEEAFKSLFFFVGFFSFFFSFFFFVFTSPEFGALCCELTRQLPVGEHHATRVHQTVHKKGQICREGGGHVTNVFVAVISDAFQSSVRHQMIGSVFAQLLRHGAAIHSQQPAHILHVGAKTRCNASPTNNQLQMHLRKAKNPFPKTTKMADAYLSPSAQSRKLFELLGGSFVFLHE